MAKYLGRGSAADPHVNWEIEQMDQDIIKTVIEFGVALVERQHEFFLDESLDNSEHIPAIKRIADTAYRYLKANGISSGISKKVREELTSRGRELFMQEWMTTLEEDEEPLNQEDRQEARRTFDELLKGK